MTYPRFELPRKLVHVASGGFALLLRWLSPAQAAACAAGALLFNLFLLHSLTGRRLLREDERRRGFSWGTTLYPLAVLILILVFHRRLELAAGGWALLAFGDGMATLAGILVGGPALPWNPRKTWIGFASFILWGTAAAAWCVRWTQLGVHDRSGAGEGSLALGTSFLSVMPVESGISASTHLILGCLAAACAAALAESIDCRIDDNVRVPLIGGSALWLAASVDPARLAAALPAVGSNLVVGAAVNAALALAALLARTVTRSGAAHGWCLGTLIYAFAGWSGFLLLLLFFALGSAATRIGRATKERAGIAEAHGGRRGARNAWANGSTALLFAFLGVATAQGRLCALGFAAALATATFDTVSAEIGKAHGRRHRLITTLRQVPAGTEGAVSVEGTLAGVVGAAVLAAAALGSGIVGGRGFWIVLLAACVGATVESLLGALLAPRHSIDNHWLNLTNTVVGALTAIGLGWWLV